MESLKNLLFVLKGVSSSAPFRYKKQAKLCWSLEDD